MASFYDLDYIIDINERRIEQYAGAYQKVLERLTNIIIIYSALSIFLVPIIQDLFLCPGKWFLCACFAVFVLLFIISVVNTVRLIIPVDVTYLSPPRRYYFNYRIQYEQENNKDRSVVESLLKASYIKELEESLTWNELVFRRKSSFYYNALMYSLLSVIPYLVCFGAFVAKKEDSVQKIEVVNNEKCSNLQTNSNMADSTNNTKDIKGISDLPGVDSSKVIPSSPIYIKENSYTPTVKDKKKK